MVSAGIDEYLAKQSPPQRADVIAQIPALKPVIFDGDHPIHDYFISSSHNTYLVANQLWGSSSPVAYTETLKGNETRPPTRCVEIDAWYSSSKGPIVTHGHTFTKAIPFKDVCEAIGAAIQANDAPITVALECHVEVEKQPELVDIMKTAWGDKLVSEPLHTNIIDKIAGIFDHSKGRPTPNDMLGKIFLMVEYYPSQPLQTIKRADSDDSSSSSSDSDFSDNEGAQEMKKFHESHKQNHVKIHEKLAALGVYANSVKPKGVWHSTKMTDPIHALINVSENAIAKLLPHSAADLTIHSLEHLRRCYPRGTRVQSTNMNPLPVWRCGTQVAAMNMQVWDLGVELNCALFAGTNGWVLKPESLRGGHHHHKRSGKTKFKLEIIGADDIPNPTNSSKLATYIKAELFTPEKTHEWTSKIDKDHGGDPTWNETIEIEYEDADLIFFRLRMYQDRWGKDTKVASYCAHIDRLEKGLRFWPLVDGEGNHCVGKLLVRYGDISEAPVPTAA